MPDLPPQPGPSTGPSLFQSQSPASPLNVQFSVSISPHAGGGGALPFATSISFPGAPTPAILPVPQTHQGQRAPAPQPSGASVDQNELEVKFRALCERFSEPRLRRHIWGWENGDYLPFYRYGSAASIQAVWEEWTEGLSGFLAVRDLETQWGARWRRNAGDAKTEHGRRRKVTGLIQELMDLRGWKSHQVLQFLSKRYGAYDSPRKLADYVQKAAQRASIIDCARTFRF